MTKELKPCPFCGGEAKYSFYSDVFDGWGTPFDRHKIICKKCGAEGPTVSHEQLSDFTNYTVKDFRNNPILRAKIEDEFEEFKESKKQEVIEAWNKRVNND